MPEDIPTPMTEEDIPNTSVEESPTQERIAELKAQIAELIESNKTKDRLIRAMEEHELTSSEDRKEKDKVIAELIESLKNQNPKLEADFKKMEWEANTDKLTGVLSRRGLDTAAKQAIGGQLERLRAQRWSGEHQRQDDAERMRPEFLSFIFLDVDRFKDINDKHGHDTGDKVLQQIGEAMNIYVRGDDFAGRWGGEEFVLCVKSSNDDDRKLIAERLRRAISEIDVFDKNGVKVQVTASFGVANWVEGELPEDTVGRADAALYLAKNAGRDQVVTESLVGGKSYYQTKFSNRPIPKEEVDEFLRAKAKE